MPSNRIRFNVFKRDGFICQYCGRTPPAVILELDHITPKSSGGAETLDNYITACFECNRGKGKEPLNMSPPAVQERLELLKERRLQLKAYNRLLEKQHADQAEAIATIEAAFNVAFPEKTITDNFREVTIRKFITSLPTPKVKEAMVLACSVKPDDPASALKYFCGICWNWIKRPETRGW